MTAQRADEKQYSTAEVAKKAGVHKDTLLRWLRGGLVPEPSRDRHGWRSFSPVQAEAVMSFASSPAAGGELMVSPGLSTLDCIDWDFAGAKTSYLTHGIHPYPAKYIPQIPNVLIQELSAVGDVVADVFCGSGTTLVEALTLKRHAVGIDASPLACLVSKAKTGFISDEDAEVLAEIALRAQHAGDLLGKPLEAGGCTPKQSELFPPKPFNSSGWRPAHESLQFWFDGFVIEELAECLQWCRAITSDTARNLALTAFSSIVVTVSKQDSDTRYVRREKRVPPGETFRRFGRALEHAARAAGEFSALAEQRFKCRVIETDILSMPDIGAVDLVVCSPPYPNAYSYHLYHRTRMLWLGMDQRKFKKEEIGSHRKYSSRSKNGANADTFLSEFSTIMKWLGVHLKKGGFACFVVGDSTLKGRLVNNAEFDRCSVEQGWIHRGASHPPHVANDEKSVQPGNRQDQNGNCSDTAKQRDPMTTVHCRMKAYIQPFERQLALEELRAVAGEVPAPLHKKGNVTEFTVRTEAPARRLADRLAYWEVVRNDGEWKPTLQSLREATASVVRSGIDSAELSRLLPFNGPVPLPNRRCLRYGTHGIHEYRGKFFPQLVKSLINIAGVGPNGIVADPMSGSGTTPVEAMLQGCHGLGLDMNPLSVFLARTKCRLLSVKPATLGQHYREIRKRLTSETQPCRRQGLAYLESLPTVDRQYLTSWFSRDALFGLDEIASSIQAVGDEAVRDFMRVCLSNILRRVSWQKDDDLRVRKEVRLDVKIDPKKEFLGEIERSVRAVLAFLYQNGVPMSGSFEVGEGDAKDSPGFWAQHKGRVDAVITSPPYATALPYLDTDRLSLCYLGLLSRVEHRERDKRMIGNREVTERMRRELWVRFEQQGKALPRSARDLITQIHELNVDANVGFRRRNLPALLTKYFFDMAEVLRGVFTLLKPGGWSFFVVGNNHTVAGGRRVEIRTAGLLRDIAGQIGFEVSKAVPMEMLASRDIFRKNAMASEEILAFQRPV